MAQPAQLAHILASSPYQEYGSGPRQSISSPNDSPASDARYFPTSASLVSANTSHSSDSDETGYSYSSPPSSAQSSAHTSYSSHFYDCYQPQVAPGHGDPATYGYAHSSPLPSDMSASIYNPSQHQQHAQPYSQPMQSHVSLGGPLPPHPSQMNAPHQQQQHSYHLPPVPYGSVYGGMDTSIFRDQLGALPPIQAPRAGSIPGLSMDRPAPKRSKTAPSSSHILSSPPSETGTAVATSTPIRRPPNPNREKRPAGKNGEDVWPEDVEIAFFECESRLFAVALIQ